MKVLIIALLALPVCLSKSLQTPQTLGKDGVQDTLNVWFNLTPADLKKECSVNFDSKWQEIGASLIKLGAVFDSIHDEVLKGAKTYTEQLRNEFKDKCGKSDNAKTARKNVVKTALPCADENSVKIHAKKPEKVDC